MSFAKFSSDFLMETFTLVDNLFINEHLPYCDEKQIKVYLYGLYLCNNPPIDNSLKTLCSRLNMTENEIISAYTYFEDMGLCQIISKEPLEVKYLSLKHDMQPAKKYKAEKWNDFNIHIQQLFPNRMLTPNELNEYYTFLDESKMEQEAMLMIVQYCINIKGENVRYPYILTVARNWLVDGVRTASDVEDKLSEYDKQSEQMQKVLSALGRKGGAELEEKQMLLKWTRTWGYELDAIITAIKTLKSNKNFKRLDSKLDEFYRLSIFSSQEMEDYAKHHDKLRDIAININKNLGIYYDSIEHEIEVYIAPWLSKGFEDNVLLEIAHQCFTGSIKTLEGMNSIVNKYYSQGLITMDSIKEFISIQIALDKKIKAIIEAAGRTRNVTPGDREYYKTWTNVWGFNDDIIIYVANMSKDITYPMSYINRVLSQYKSDNIYTIDKATTYNPISTRTQHVRDFEEREYTEEEIQSVISSIDSTDIKDL